LGGKKLLTIYVLGGISGSLVHVAYENLYKRSGARRNSDTPALGASGSVMSIGMLYACMFPTSTVLIWGIIPVPALVLFGGYFIYDLYNSLSGRRGSTSHSGHVGGALFGLLYYFGKIRRGGLRIR
jgi:membrane associated rhomboid family serine protease